MLQHQPPDYMRYFTPFQFDEKTVYSILSSVKRDVYMGFYWNGQLIGFFMLRGWDSGYEIPSYGVTIHHRFRNLGLAFLSIELAKVICRLCGASGVMLKVHRENEAARRVYEKAGFMRTGEDPKNDNWVYRLDL